MERRNLSLERHKNIFVLGDVLSLPTTVGHLLPAIGQQVQQDADREVRLPSDVAHFLHDIPNPYQLHAHLSHLWQDILVSILE